MATEDSIKTAILAKIPDADVVVGSAFSTPTQPVAPAAGAPSGATPATTGVVAPAPTLANNSWNSEGLTMTQSRYLMGSSVQSAFIFLLGGQTNEPSSASKTTELVIW